MDFPKEELLEKYVNIYEEYIADYVPDFEVKDGTTRYVRFNDSWRGLNPFEKLLITRIGEGGAHAWCFQDFQKYPNQMTFDMVRQMMPDRIFNPNKIEYTFERVPDGLEYTSNYYFRRSQTLTDKGHISEDTLTHLAENGIRLV